MTEPTLALELRPRKFEDFLGNSATIKAIKAKLAADVLPTGFLLVGPTGTGKTTAAMLIAEKARGAVLEGDPDLVVRNTSDLNGVDAIRSLVSNTESYAMSGRYRVHILNDCERLTDAAQGVLLEPLEAKASTTVWIFTTTRPEKLRQDLRDRCLTFQFAPFGQQERTALLNRAVSRFGAAAQPLIDAVNKAALDSGRAIVNACEQWISGLSPEDAVATAGGEQDPLYADIARAMMAGNWAKTQALLSKIKSADVAGLRGVTGAFLRNALLREEDPKRLDTLAEAAMKLAICESFVDGVSYAAFVGFAYRLCQRLRS